jgi:hypothetical protein
MEKKKFISRQFEDLVRGSDSIRSLVEETGDIKAPEGFTQKVMYRVNLEAVPSRAGKDRIFSTGFKVSAIAVFIALITASILYSGSGNIDSDVLPSWLSFITNIKLDINLPDLSFLSKFSIVLYLVISSAALFFLDSLTYIIRADIKSKNAI